MIGQAQAYIDAEVREYTVDIRLHHSACTEQMMLIWSCAFAPRHIPPAPQPKVVFSSTLCR
jgi:hypothetical protein